MRTLKIEQIEALLKCWEDLNLIADINFKRGLGDKEAPQSPLIGSEVDARNLLARAFPEYKKLRTFLDLGRNFDCKSFIPRVPKIHRDKIKDQFAFFQTFGQHSYLLFPFFVEGWNYSKKVCSVTENAQIGFLSLAKENYLKYLPYDNFIIQLNIKVERVFKNKSLFYQTIMVRKEGKYVHMLAVPNELEQAQYSPVHRSMLTEMIQLFHNNKSKYEKKRVKLLDGLTNEEILTLFGSDLQMGLMHCNYIVINSENGKIHMYTDLLEEKELLLPEENEVAGFVSNNKVVYTWLAYYVNGFCKALSEAKNPSNILFTDMAKISQNSVHVDSVKNDTEKLEWNEVPIGNVVHLAIESDKEGRSVVLYHGGEKCPHARRGHWRTLNKKDGSVEEIWVQRSYIHEEKLPTASVKSGSSIISQ